MSRFPDDVKYSPHHLWVRLGDGRSLRVGATDYLVESSGSVVHVSLPTVGADLRAGDACGELVGPSGSEAIIAPVTGVVTAVNQTLSDQPESVRQDPYHSGWLFEQELAAVEHGSVALMDADGYEVFVGE